MSPALPRPRGPLRRGTLIGLVAAALVALLGTDVLAASGHLDLAERALDSEGWGPAIKLLLLFAAVSLLPTLVLGMTCFVRIVVVLSLLRQAVGVVQLPPSRVLVGMALFLTLFVMAPTFTAIYDRAVVPYDNGELTEREALEAGIGPLREFMLRETHESDLALMVRMRGGPRPQSRDEISTLTLIPAFMLSELRTAFQIGALLFLPFLVIDLVVASVLMSMGMMMLPPMTISLPIKLIVFVLVDGWALVVQSLVQGFSGGG